MPLLPREPFIEIHDDHTGRVAIHVQHYGRVPDLALEFSPEVLRQAVNKWGRTPREHRILTAARKLSPTAFRVVEAHLIRERALAVEQKLAQKSSRASWSQPRAEEPHSSERENPTVERAEHSPEHDRTPAPLQRQRSSSPDRRAGTGDRVADARRPELPRSQQHADPPRRSRPETLTERAQRELEETKARRPKPSRSERTAIQRALAEREESLRDLVEFIPARPRETLTEKARRTTAAEPAKPQPGRDRDRSR